jgi:hypothetical protein
MKITGTKLRTTIAVLELQKEALYKKFKGEQQAFKDEDKKPMETFVAIQKLEERLVRIQAVREVYNANVTFVFNGKHESIAYLSKIAGALGRQAKLFRDIVSPKEDRWEARDTKIREEGKEIAKPTITADDAMKKFPELDAISVEARNALAGANNIEFETALLTEADMAVSS